MIQSKGFYKRFVKSGPGGMKCACCFPQTNPGKKAELRNVKRAERRFFQQLIKEELE